MSRKISSSAFRDPVADPKYGDMTVQQFINCLLKKGKKSVAELICYDALAIMEKKGGGEPGLEVFRKALNNVKPSVEVKSRRVGGATYQVPVEVRPRRRNALAMRWIIQYASARNEKTMADRLAAEFAAAARGEGSSVKKRDDTHKMAEANKAFAHFRW